MRVLHIEDNPDDAALIHRLLATEWPACRVTRVDTRTTMEAEIAREPVDVILCDFSFPAFDGFEALQVAKHRTPDTPFIFVSGTIGEDRAIEAVRRGADDYILKDRPKRVVPAIMRALRAVKERKPRTGTDWMHTDITDRERLHEQFLRAQRMENLGLLAAGIAHDLNNTLAPILLAAPMLREQVGDGSGLKLVDTLERSAERGSQLVRQILSFAHGVGGEHQLVQPKHLLRDIASVIDGTFPKSIELQSHIASDLWPVKGNPTQIHQVLLNLCVNARDAMPAGGTLRLRAENVTVQGAVAATMPQACSGSFVMLQVEDTGTGIPPEILTRMWEPFFTTKEAGRGTGLGLSTVRSIVEAHRGYLDVQSRLGEGTRFRVYLPAAELTAPDRGDASLRSRPCGRGELVLVVDDEDQIRDITAEILGRHGYRVICACDGTDATAVLAQRADEIRLVISDLHMPNLDGATLARMLRRSRVEAKILMMSGMASGLGDGVEFQSEECADGLILKPFRPDELLQAVARLLYGGTTPAVHTAADRRY
jgi:signal transduction histidine kinase